MAASLFESESPNKSMDTSPTRFMMAFWKPSVGEGAGEASSTPLLTLHCLEFRSQFAAQQSQGWGPTMRGIDEGQSRQYVS